MVRSSDKGGDVRIGGGGEEGTTSIRGVRPWGEFAKKYFDAGWCPLPLPPRKKSSPPTGSTGKYDMPDKKKIVGWHRQKDARGNIAIRVPDGVIGIDVDAYDAKVGAASLRTLEKELGALPPTWTLTSRSDGVSGIRFYQVPPGLHWSGEPIDDVQIVQNHHRYAVVYPSVHPDTRKLYQWYAPGDALSGVPSITVEHEIPTITELPLLPDEWVEALSGGRVWKGLAADSDATAADLIAWLKARPGGSMCRLMRKQAEAAVAEMSVGGAHDTLNSRVYSMVSLATEGHAGIGRAIRRIRDAFYEEVTREGRKGRRSEQSARLEFNRVRDGAVRIMMASCADGESSLEEECGCAGSSLDWGEQLGIVSDEPSAGGVEKMGKAKSPDKYTFDDSGNAEHMLDILDGSAFYIGGEKVWYFWDVGRGAWQPDLFGSRALQAAQLVGKRCREQSDRYMDQLKASGSSLTLDAGGEVATRIAQLDKHAKVSSDHKGLSNMVKVAAAQSRAERRVEEFDASPALLACSNGTLELGSGGVVFRPAVRADLLSLSTGVRYVPGATSAAWDRYLRRFVPNVGVRRYLQKVAGYTLLGRNVERKLFFMQGDTSTGKTTFVNALSGALGQYSGTMNLSLFRDNQDEKPRPDLVRGLGKRLLAASEASAEWHLHGDQVKRLTGGDAIRARLLHANTFVERKPAFTPWIATNAYPSVSGVDRALWRRLVCIPFRESVEAGAEDFTVEVELDSVEGREAVLAWAVAGWNLYVADGLSAPSAVEDATAEMLGELSDLDVFLRGVLEPDPTGQGKVPFDELFDRWRMWCEDANVDNKMSKRKFAGELTGRGFGIQKGRLDGAPKTFRTGFVWQK